MKAPRHEWDKDDLDALGITNSTFLALGMVYALRTLRTESNGILAKGKIACRPTTIKVYEIVEVSPTPSRVP